MKRIIAVELAIAERRRRKELQDVINAFREEAPEDLTASKRALKAVWPD